MDCGWWDEKNLTLWLIELKGRGVWLSEAKRMMRQCRGLSLRTGVSPSGKLSHSLLVKAVDSMMILGAIWSETETGSDFLNELPVGLARYPGAGNIVLVFIVDTPSSDRGLLVAVRDRLNGLLSGKLQLFGIRRAEVVDVNTAVRPVLLRRSRMKITAVTT